MTATDTEDPAGGSRTRAVPRVFVSHAAVDAAAALRFVAALELQGIRCWIAPRDVMAGAQYADAIVRAISESPIFLVLLSAQAIASPHVGREVERAGSKGCRILALRLDSTPLTPALEYFLGESQWVDLQDGEPAAQARLMQAIRQAPEPATVAANPARPAPKSPPRQVRRAVLIASGIAIVVVAALLVGKIMLAPKGAGQASNPATSAMSTDKSIAVLPFTDMSEKHDQEYFAEGMAEEVLDLLAKIPGLTVIGRTSSFQFNGSHDDLRAIGAKLGVAHLLEGSVRSAGDRIRITAQLIDARTGAQEWSDTYDRQLGDVLKLQGEIAAAVARELQIRVAVDTAARATLKDPRAYDLVLRGRHAADRNDEAGFSEAVTLYTQALALDPASSDAASHLGEGYRALGDFGYLRPGVAFEKARQAAELAIRLDPKNAGAYSVRGTVEVLYDWNWPAAAISFQKEARLAPGSADVLHDLGFLALVQGQWDEAYRSLKASNAQDPLEPRTLVLLSLATAARGEAPEAEELARRTLAIRQSYNWAHYLLGCYLVQRGDGKAALAEMQLESAEFVKRTGLAIAYHALGRQAESEAILARMIAERAHENPFEIAEVYAMRGDADRAMPWLERAYSQKDANISYLKTYPQWSRLHSDPRYRAFLRKLNLPVDE